MSNREKFDYNVSFNPQNDDAIDALNKAKFFIEKVKPYILSKIEIE